MQPKCASARRDALLLLLAVAPIASEAGAFYQGRKAFEAPVEPHKERPTSDAKAAAGMALRANGSQIPGVHQLLRFKKSAYSSRVSAIVAAGGHAAKMHHLDPNAVLEMEKSVLDLLTGKTGGTPQGDSVVQIKNLINATMKPKVINAHNENQKELNELKKKIDSCDEAREHGVQLANSKTQKYQASSPLHKTCRNAEAALVTELRACEVSLNAAKQVKELRCQKFDDLEREWGNEARNKQVASKMNGESVKMYIKRLSATYCGDGDGHPGEHGSGGSMWERFLLAEKQCKDATEKLHQTELECGEKELGFKAKNKECNNIQRQMDDAACSAAILTKDSCESYAECFTDTNNAYNLTVSVVKTEEADRKVEWGALGRMLCLIDAFTDNTVTTAEVTACQNANHNTTHLNITYPPVPSMMPCVVPSVYPATAAYKKAEFAPLPTLAKGNPEANECHGVLEISTKPKAGSPANCVCTRVTMNGHFSPGALVKCERCLDVSKSVDKDSCPEGTKIFSPRTRSDWRTFFQSAQPLRQPNWIIDITRPKNGCGGCNTKPMTSLESDQSTWTTKDGSPWWLRSTVFAEPSTDYLANCYLDIAPWPLNEDQVTPNADGCKFHSSAYYCQAKKISTTPKHGSPVGCSCSIVALTGRYSPGQLIKCVGCIDVHRSNEKNSCPDGTKIFTPRSREDWKTFIDSAMPLRSPHWIIDVTRPQNGCAGCTHGPMNFEFPTQVSWTTEDGSPWWLRSTTYNEPNGDYKASCYLDLWHNPPNPDSITFNDGNCNYHSNSYYCQPTLTQAR